MGIRPGNLTPRSLLEAARQQTGLADFGDCEGGVAVAVRGLAVGTVVKKQLGSVRVPIVPLNVMGGSGAVWLLLDVESLLIMKGRWGWQSVRVKLQNREFAPSTYGNHKTSTSASRGTPWRSRIWPVRPR